MPPVILPIKWDQKLKNRWLPSENVVKQSLTFLNKISTEIFKSQFYFLLKPLNAGLKGLNKKKWDLKISFDILFDIDIVMDYDKFVI